MKVLFIALILSTSFIGQVHSETVAPPATTLSDRDRIKVDRAKAAAEEKNSTTARPWDRDFQRQTAMGHSATRLAEITLAELAFAEITLAEMALARRRSH